MLNNASITSRSGYPVKGPQAPRLRKVIAGTNTTPTGRYSDRGHGHGRNLNSVPPPSELSTSTCRPKTGLKTMLAAAVRHTRTRNGDERVHSRIPVFTFLRVTPMCSTSFKCVGLLMLFSAFDACFRLRTKRTEIRGKRNRKDGIYYLHLFYTPITVAGGGKQCLATDGCRDYHLIRHCV